MTEYESFGNRVLALHNRWTIVEMFLVEGLVFSILVFMMLQLGWLIPIPLTMLFIAGVFGWPSKPIMTFMKKYMDIGEPGDKKFVDKVLSGQVVKETLMVLMPMGSGLVILLLYHSSYISIVIGVALILIGVVVGIVRGVRDDTTFKLLTKYIQ